MGCHTRSGKLFSNQIIPLDISKYIHWKILSQGEDERTHSEEKPENYVEKIQEHDYWPVYQNKSSFSRKLPSKSGKLGLNNERTTSKVATAVFHFHSQSDSKFVLQIFGGMFLRLLL